MTETVFDARVLETGKELYRLLGDGKPPAFKKDYWSGRVLEWAIRDEAFKVQMFRFVDVFPYLKTSSQVARHLQEYFGETNQMLPRALTRRLLSLSPDSLSARIAAHLVGRNIRGMASQFIAGESAHEALRRLRRIREQGAAFTVALLGEAVVSESEADAYAERYLQTIQELERDRENWKPLGDDAQRDWGAAAQVNVSVKATALYSQLHPEASEHSVAAAKERLLPILREAMRCGAFIHLDMEHRELKDLTIAIYRSVLEEPEFAGYPETGIAIQAYLRDSLDDVRELLAWSQVRGQELTIRLIKGAYWDQEVIHARQHGWPVPVFTDKAATDANFESCAKLILEHDAPVRLACGSHNIRSIAYVRELSLLHREKTVEFQALYGMAEPVKNALVAAGFPVRMYVPVGDLLPGMAYLVRRLLENTSNESFLLHSFSRGETAEQLLLDPAKLIRRQEPAQSHDGRFRNEPPVDWSIRANRDRFDQALRGLELPKRAPLFLAGKEHEAAQWISSFNPSRPSDVVALAASAGIDHADQAVAAARQAFSPWRDVNVRERSDLLFRAAAIMRERRYELAALQVFEVGKVRSEADGDVCEAIDFLEFYGREMLRLAEPRSLGDAPGEDSRLVFEPRGVAAVIAPWNFPLAISTGMTAAALVAGNTVVYKPAEDSVGVGSALSDVLRQAGVPDGVFNFLPGEGSTVGARLVAHPDVQLIVFTGSMEVGLQIVESCGRVPEGAREVKKVIAEMGGKNAIIVDADADFDVAIREVIYSAFGYQGQKCSACSRLILPESIHDSFLERLLPAIESIQLGDADDPSTYVGPVISEEARQKILRYIEIGKQEGQLALYRSRSKVESFAAPIAVFIGIRPEHRLAQEEIFGPVLAVLKVRDYDHALEVANSTRFALTGGVFSRSPVNIQKARRQFQIGNLYINRGCTGAIVERHPFGGFKLSGLGTKAGGTEYLKEFMVMRTITENTLRQGFAPPSG
jgi:RHH-type proline utilization regulon transcriptional repressor/proline dehydrogenase/delta 1-pyrroline-5-carboxylate dehydrogenase